MARSATTANEVLNVTSNGGMRSENAGSMTRPQAQKKARENVLLQDSEYLAELHLLPEFIAKCRADDLDGTYFLDCAASNVTVPSNMTRPKPGKVAPSAQVVVLDENHAGEGVSSRDVRSNDNQVGEETRTIILRTFFRVFISFSSWKKVFLSEGTLPFLAVDACHMKHVFGHVCLAAVGVDSENHICPLAVAVVPSEDCDNVNWFFEQVGTVLGNRKVCFMTDQGSAFTSISLADWIVSNGHFHSFCAKHLWDFIRKKFKNLKGVQQLIQSVAHSRTKEFAEKCLQELEGKNVEVSEYVRDRLEHVAAFGALDRGFRRGGRITSQLVESFFHMIQLFREGGLVSGIIFLHNLTSRQYERRFEALNTIPEEKHLTVASQERYDAVWRKSSNISVKICSLSITLVESEVTVSWQNTPLKVVVSTTHVPRIRLSCPCRLLEEEGVPCRHLVRTLQTASSLHSPSCPVRRKVGSSCSDDCAGPYWKRFLGSDSLSDVFSLRATALVQYGSFAFGTTSLKLPEEFNDEGKWAVDLLKSTMKAHGCLDLYPPPFRRVLGDRKVPRKTKTRQKQVQHSSRDSNLSWNIMIGGADLRIRHNRPVLNWSGTR